MKSSEEGGKSSKMALTENPHVFSHFYSDFVYFEKEVKYLWDDSVGTVFVVKHYSSLLLSALCVFLNSLLVLFLATNKGFRDLKFFPLALQAVVDIIGPGMANFVFEIVSYRNVKKEVFMFRNDGLSVRSMEFTLSRIGGVPGCLLALLRMVLNEYTTGKLTSKNRTLKISVPRVQRVGKSTFSKVNEHMLAQSLHEK